MKLGDNCSVGGCVISSGGIQLLYTPWPRLDCAKKNFRIIEERHISISLCKRTETQLQQGEQCSIKDVYM
jgi:hypothetical protein